MKHFTFNISPLMTFYCNIVRKSFTCLKYKPYRCCRPTCCSARISNVTSLILMGAKMVFEDRTHRLSRNVGMELL